MGTILWYGIGPIPWYGMGTSLHPILSSRWWSCTQWNLRCATVRAWSWWSWSAPTPSLRSPSASVTSRGQRWWDHYCAHPQVVIFTSWVQFSFCLLDNASKLLSPTLPRALLFLFALRSAPWMSTTVTELYRTWSNSRTSKTDWLSWSEPLSVSEVWWTFLVDKIPCTLHEALNVR